MGRLSRLKQPAQLAAILLTVGRFAVGAPDSGDGLAILTARCFPCHNATVAQNNLNLTTRESALRGGERGAALVAGNAKESLIYQFASQQIRPFMPPAGAKLSPDEVKSVAAWIDAGAPYPGQPAAGAHNDAPVAVAKIAAKTDHWAFQKPVRAPLPKVNGALAAWDKNPVDALLAARWLEKGLQPAPEADHRTLLRRVYIDVTGLPPTEAQTEAFLKDRSPDAYEKIVDSLLASPQYGERWGRHWMDIWRYSDWYGRRGQDDQRNSARNIWHWRDWIIESLNADKGYDQMIREMVAGDEIAPNDPNVVRATGYLARNYYRFNRNVWLQDTVEHLGFGVLGLTLKCARCHDHKYDPISQEEYYRMRAFFEPYDVRMDRIPGKQDPHDDSIARVYDSAPHDGGTEPYFPAIYKDTFRFIRGDETNPDKTPLAPGTLSVLGNWTPKIEPVTYKPEEHMPDLRGFVGTDMMAKARQDIKDAERRVDALTKSLERVRTESASHKEQTVAAKDKTPSVKFADVQAVLNVKCSQCHGGMTQATSRSGLTLTSEAGALQGGYKHGPAIIPGHSSESPLIRYISGDLTPRMPVEGGAVTPAEAAKLAQWIDGIVEEPAVALRKAEERLTLAKLHLESVKLFVPALEARLAADRAKYLQAEDKAKLEDLSDKAQKAEQKYVAAFASEETVEAQQLLGSDKAGAAKTKLEAAAKALGAPAVTYSPVGEIYPETSTGRRTALAEWLVSKDNPLPARVAVNDIWLRHFGKPIVSTVSNFGRNGAKPTDQRLLDTLAVDFMESGWSMKKLHRTILTSKAYRMASSGAALSEANKQIDPDNKFFWHMNPHRMEAETIRDAVLYQAGLLDLTTGGPEIDETQAFTSRRRSLYLRQTPDSQAQFLKLYDQPIPTDCYVRPESIMPQQALASANSTFFQEASRLLAKSLSGPHTGDEAFVRAAFDTIFNTPPTALELAESRRFLASQTTLLAQPERLTRFSEVVDTHVAPATDAKQRARENLIHALLNHNEFITVR